MDLKTATEQELSAEFAKLQDTIVAAQTAQTEIDKERRRRYAETQRAELERRRAELAAFEKSLEV